ncbi:MAG TPA: hypothetical protein PKN11_09090 [Anaerolineaceae bacterium]|nr:hypothetical protein [Anaerolineaceae bacterium]
MIFSLMPAYGGDERETILLARSIRQFAGVVADSAIHVMEPEQSPLSTAARRALEELSVSVFPFCLPPGGLDFPLAQKVYAAAEAEDRAGKDLLVWMDSDTMVLDQPDAFQLPESVSLGCCPVHLKNISSLFSQPLDDFWREVFGGCGVSLDRLFPVVSTMDAQEIYAHFNAGLLVVRPKAGILRTWRENFERLYLDRRFAPLYAERQARQFFFSQAVLAATIVQMLAREKIQLFSPRYNHPIMLVERYPVSITDPITCRYDAYSVLERCACLRLKPGVTRWLHDSDHSMEG